MDIHPNTEIRKPMPEMPMMASRAVGGRSRWLRWLATLVVIVAVLLAALYLVSRFSGWNVLGLSKPLGNYQAIFLSNGQVYFGQVAARDEREVTLRDVYYLQVSQPLQRSGEANSNTPAPNELSLVKLGNELHGPQDEMRINYDQVLFVEDLKEGSKVVQAIRNYKSQTKGQ